MPIEKVNGGYKWGKSGKVYPTKAQAAKQARAAYASGYKGYQPGGPVTQSTNPYQLTGEAKDSWTHDETGGEQTQDTFVKDFMKQMGLMSLMSNPNTRPGFIKGMSALNFFKNPSKKTGIGALAPWLGFNRSTRDLVKFLPFLADPSARTAKGIAQKWAQNQGLGALFKKYGPKAAYSLFNQGGNFGLGEGGPMGQGILPNLANNPLQTIGKLKYALGNLPLAGIMALLNRVSPRIPGQKGILDQGLGPQLRNFFSRLLPGLKSYGEKHGMGQDTEEDLYPDIQEIDVTAQRRPTEEQLLADQLSSIRGAQAGMFGGGAPGIDYMVADDKTRPSELMDFYVNNAKYGEGQINRLGETGGLSEDHLSGLVPGAAMSTNQELRAANWARSGPHRKLMAKIASGQMPVRKISAGGGGRK